MTEITAIQKTKRGRYSLFADGEFLFSVDAETLAKSELCEGTRLDEAELLRLKDQSDTRKASDAALRYLSLRAYGQQELYAKLLLRFDEHSCAAALTKMADAGLLDDEQFARQKADGMAQRGKSPLEIKRKLASLGIDRGMADAAVDDLKLDGAGAALAVIQKSYIEKLQRGERQKVMAALARRGFTHREIDTAVGLAMEELAGRGEESE